MWFLGGYGFTDGSFGAVEDSADSILASIGSVIAVIFTPLGFGKWQPVAASLSGFSAKEAIVTTMGVLANVAGDTEDPAVVAHGVATWFPSAAAGFSFLLFNLWIRRVWQRSLPWQRNSMTENGSGLQSCSRTYLHT